MMPPRGAETCNAFCRNYGRFSRREYRSSEFDSLSTAPRSPPGAVTIHHCRG
jgi:hypothetical protein